MKSKSLNVTSPLMLAGVCALLGTAHAQRGGSNNANSGGGKLGNTGGSGGTPALVKAVDKYVLGPQDVIGVTIERFPDYGAERVIVPPDGKISLPYFGEPLYVIGKTTRQVQQELTARINKRIRNPRISVSIKEIRNAALGNVFVVGSVQNQGTIDIYKGYRLTEVLAKAGGATKRLDEVAANLSRGGKSIPIDLYQAVSYPQSPANVRVQPDDVITVQAIDPGRISVSGDIKQSGVYELRRAPQTSNQELPLEPHLTDLIVAAGGFESTEKTDDGLVTGFVQRGPQRIELNVQAAVDFQDPAADIVLKPGDFVTFKMEQPLSIDVLGEVKVPGNQKVAPGGKVLNAVALAGGTTGPFEQFNATLQRDGRLIDIDLSAISAGDPTTNLTLQSGDTIQISPIDVIKVTVSGAVSSPNASKAMELPPGSRVYDAISRAGGLTPTLKIEEARITIVRRIEGSDPKFLAVNAEKLLAQRDQSQNAVLQNGDIVNVTEAAEQSAVVTGKIIKPGPVILPEGGQDIATVIARAGGQTPDASLRNVTIKRADGRVQTVDVYDAVINGRVGSLGADGMIQAGDYISIGENIQGVLVAGAVGRQGKVPLPEGRQLTVLEALGEAGGTAPGARTQEIALVRAPKTGTLGDGTKGTVEPQVTILDLRQLKDGKTAGANLIVQAGDVIIVPEGKYKQSTLSKAGSVLGLLSIARSFGGF